MLTQMQSTDPSGAQGLIWLKLPFWTTKFHYSIVYSIPDCRPAAAAINHMATTVRELLEQHELGQYAAAFDEEGWDSLPNLRAILAVDISQLVADTKMKSGHVVRLRVALGLPPASAAPHELAAPAPPAPAPLRRRRSSRSHRHRRQCRRILPRSSRRCTRPCSGVVLLVSSCMGDSSTPTRSRTAAGRPSKWLVVRV